jgi:hypothetical protein
VNGQEIPGRVANIDARAARFAVPEGTTDDDVDAIRIDGYRVLYPIQVPFELTFDEPVTVIDGVTATLVQVLEQPDSTVLRIELGTDRDLSHVDVKGVGAGWRSAVREFDADNVWSLTREGAVDFPVLLELRGSMWGDIESDAPVLLGGR